MMIIINPQSASSTFRVRENAPIFPTDGLSKYLNQSDQENRSNVSVTTFLPKKIAALSTPRAFT